MEVGRYAWIGHEDRPFRVFRVFRRSKRQRGIGSHRFPRLRFGFLSELATQTTSALSRLDFRVAGVERSETPERTNWGFSSLNPSHPNPDFSCDKALEEFLDDDLVDVVAADFGLFLGGSDDLESEP